MRRVALIIALLILVVSAGFLYVFGRGYWVPLVKNSLGRQTVADVISEVGVGSRQRLQESFRQASVDYPPERVHLLAIKDTRILEIWAGEKENPVYIKSLAIKAASGVAGPKLREGDRQVPEGIYNVTGLNPNSSFHLSMKLNYPNAFDLQHAAIEGRSSPGSDIFIHGKAVSVGCLAIGDAAIEDLFVLAVDAGVEKIRVVIAPADPRVQALKFGGNKEWVDTLYHQITREFSYFDKPQQSG